MGDFRVTSLYLFLTKFMELLCEALYFYSMDFGCVLWIEGIPSLYLKEHTQDSWHCCHEVALSCRRLYFLLFEEC